MPVTTVKVSEVYEHLRTKIGDTEAKELLDLIEQKTIYYVSTYDLEKLATKEQVKEQISNLKNELMEKILTTKNELISIIITENLKTKTSILMYMITFWITITLAIIFTR